jgi:hypothetical protein
MNSKGVSNFTYVSGLETVVRQQSFCDPVCVATAGLDSATLLASSFPAILQSITTVTQSKTFRIRDGVQHGVE